MCMFRSQATRNRVTVEKLVGKGVILRRENLELIFKANLKTRMEEDQKFGSRSEFGFGLGSGLGFSRLRTRAAAVVSGVRGRRRRRSQGRGHSSARPDNLNDKFKISESGFD